MSHTQSTLLRNVSVVSGGTASRPADVLLRDGIIAAIGETDGSADMVVDGDGLLLIPGLVDVHVHGAGGFDATHGARALSAMAGTLAQLGTTSFLATSASLDPARTARFASDVAAAMHRGGAGAELLGAHLEGPWISPRFRGAHREAAVRPPSPEEVFSVLRAGGGAVRRVTIAPELNGARAAIQILRDHSVAVSVGHSGADVDTATAVLSEGATVTHLFNGMAPLHHRDPGVAGAALDHDGAVCELIADGVHVHPLVLRSAARALGAARTLLVSDGLPIMGTSAGTTRWYGNELRSDGHAAWLRDGSLAGSATDLLRAVDALAAATHVPFAVALRSATEVPAAVAGVAERKGVVDVGYDADVVLLDASHFVVATWCGGILANHDANLWRERVSS